MATPRQSNLRNLRKMAAGDPYYQFGLKLGEWSFEAGLEMMARLVGISPDPGHFYGDDTIDVELTLDGLDAMAGHLARAAEAKSKVIVATGHPTGLLPVHVAVAAALRAAGCMVLTPAEGWKYEVPTPDGPRERKIRYFEDVAVLSGGGSLHHTHDSAPMEEMLANLAGESRHWPDLVIADHGWAGAAGEAGITTVGFADCNDPALFAGHVVGKIDVAVPLDDNVLPRHYAPLTGYLLGRAGLLA
ncbi:phosphatase [Actinocorallia longicatena]|uniref:Phosphatase n=1 Tax=Actinocorallia longicatena TaxID=111803 RepID=A0ABP6QMX2_9ACTN